MRLGSLLCCSRLRLPCALSVVPCCISWRVSPALQPVSARCPGGTSSAHACSCDASKKRWCCEAREGSGERSVRTAGQHGSGWGSASWLRCQMRPWTQGFRNTVAQGHCGARACYTCASYGACAALSPSSMPSTLLPRAAASATPQAAASAGATPPPSRSDSSSNNDRHGGRNLDRPRCDPHAVQDRILSDVERAGDVGAKT